MTRRPVNEDLIELCREQLRLTVKRGAPAAPLTTYFIGGPIDILAEPESAEQAASLLACLSRNGEQYRILGAGSNLLIADEGLDHWVIRAGRPLRYYREIAENRIEAGAAMSLMNLSREMCQKGLKGLEFAGGIPASIGGAVFMNAGAHGGQLSDVLRSVTLATPEGVLRIPASELNFAYRKSGIPANAMVISAELEFERDSPELCVERRNHNLSERKKAQPLSSPSAGSVFKNPSPDKSAGRLIEASGLKGTIHGGAQISEKHGNWIINIERKARSSDVRALIDLCRSRVHEQFGIELETEVVYWEPAL